jgi:hypothetical protein
MGNVCELPRNRDAVIVSANDERAIMKRGVKDSFSRRVKVVGVNYSDGGHNVHRQLSSYLISNTSTTFIDKI